MKGFGNHHGSSLGGLDAALRYVKPSLELYPSHEARIALEAHKDTTAELREVLARDLGEAIAAKNTYVTYVCQYIQ